MTVQPYVYLYLLQVQSCVDVDRDVIPRLKAKAAELWADVSPESLIVRSGSKSIPIPKDISSTSSVGGFSSTTTTVVPIINADSTTAAPVEALSTARVDESLGGPNVAVDAPIVDALSVDALSVDALTVDASTSTDAFEADSTRSKIFLPEGSTVRVVKPELRIRFLPVNSLPGETVAMKFKLSDKVSAVKGWAVERVKERLSSDALVDKDRVVVTHGGERLKDNRMLVDLVFPHGDVSVAYPEDGISFRQSKLALELESDIFSMFDSQY